MLGRCCQTFSLFLSFLQLLEKEKECVVYRIDHGFEINTQGVAEDIYREIHGLSYLDIARLT